MFSLPVVVILPVVIREEYNHMQAEHEQMGSLQCRSCLASGAATCVPSLADKSLIIHQAKNAVVLC